MEEEGESKEGAFGTGKIEAGIISEKFQDDSYHIFLDQ